MNAHSIRRENSLNFAWCTSMKANYYGVLLCGTLCDMLSTDVCQLLLAGKLGRWVRWFWGRFWKITGRQLTSPVKLLYDCIMGHVGEWSNYSTRSVRLRNTILPLHFLRAWNFTQWFWSFLFCTECPAFITHRFLLKIILFYKKKLKTSLSRVISRYYHLFPLKPCNSCFFFFLIFFL